MSHLCIPRTDRLGKQQFNLLLTSLPLFCHVYRFTYQHTPHFQCITGTPTSFYCQSNHTFLPTNSFTMYVNIFWRSLYKMKGVVLLLSWLHLASKSQKKLIQKLPPPAFLWHMSTFSSQKSSPNIWSFVSKEKNSCIMLLMLLYVWKPHTNTHPAGIMRVYRWRGAKRKIPGSKRI